MKSPKFWNSLYWILLIANVVANLYAITVLSNSTKIFLMPALFLVLWLNMADKNSKLIKWTGIALFFSWLGDILLLFQNQSTIFFLLGLAAFLVAHLSYIVDFRISRNTKSRLDLKEWPLPIVLLIIFLFLLFWTIGPGLNEYSLPVIFYAVAISGMFLAAYSRSGRTSKQSYILVLLGACIFILSDSLIALNKFWMEIPIAGALIMFTYGVAQYMIIRGLIYHSKSDQ